METRRATHRGRERESFIDFACRRIEERQDITASTKRVQRGEIRLLAEYGRIRRMADVTLENVVGYADWLRARGLKQTTVWTKLKTMRHYVREAADFDLIARNPFERFRIDRGTAVGAHVLEYDDYRRIAELELEGTYAVARDIMHVQYHTGLAYSDLYLCDFTSISKAGDSDMLTGKRRKTGVPYYIPVSDGLRAVLHRWNGKVPRMSPGRLNWYYKRIGAMAGIAYSGRISSHSVRKGYATFLVNRGVPMEVIAKCLGHSSARETERIYAKISMETIARCVMAKCKMSDFNGF